MSATLVHSVCQSAVTARQTVAWSLDDRLAVSADKEISILKLRSSVADDLAGSQVHVKTTFSLEQLAARRNLWPYLQQDILRAKKVAWRGCNKRWTYSMEGDDDSGLCWTLLAWSPLGLAAEHRTVLAGLTTNHRLIITGLSPANKQWVQLADLGEQLAERHEKQFQSDREKCHSAEAILALSLTQMCSVASIDVLWSSVFVGAGGWPDCVLLFVAMKNADIVTWRITLPFTGIENCHIVDRQPSHAGSVVSSLAFSALPGNPNTGVLVVGYTDGRLNALSYCVDPSNPPDSSPHRYTQAVFPQTDYLPVTGLGCLTCPQKGLVVLSTKKQTTFAHTLSLSHRQENVGRETTEREEDWSTLRVTELCQARLGHLMEGSGITVVGDTALVATLDAVYHVIVTGSLTETEMRCERELAFDHAQTGWGCVSVCLSPNGTLAAGLFRPTFTYNHRHKDFFQPVKVHIAPVKPPEWPQLASFITSLKDNIPPLSLLDIVEYAHHTMRAQPLTLETIVKVIERLTAPPYSDSVLGLKVARYLLFMLTALCRKSKLLNEQVGVVSEAERRVSQQLMCHQVKQVCQAIRQVQHTMLDTDVLMLNTMMNWVTWDKERSEIVGSEVMGRLTSIVGEAKPDTCVVCDSQVDFTESLSVTCANKHTFGLCCHTVTVCSSVPYQCCETCGVLALSDHTLKGIPWVGENRKKCALCHSHLYNSLHSLRL